MSSKKFVTVGAGSFQEILLKEQGEQENRLI